MFGILKSGDEEHMGLMFLNWALESTIFVNFVLFCVMALKGLVTSH